MLNLISFFLVDFFNLFLSFWWLILPLITTHLFIEKYHSDKVKTFVKGKLKYRFLEIIFPEESLKNPQLMDEVLVSLHSSAAPFSSLKQILTGSFPLAYIFILEFHDRKMRFFIGANESVFQFIKTSFYSKYPEIKFKESDSPLKKFNFNFPNPLYDGLMFEVIPEKTDFVILKTYKNLEKLPPEERIDPAAGFWEIKEAISNKEWLYFIFFALPVLADDATLGKKWIETYKGKIDEIIGKPKPPEPKPLSYYLNEFFNNLLTEIYNIFIGGFLKDVKPIVWTPIKSTPQPFEFNIGKLTPEQKEIIDLILEKIKKPGYLVRIEALYLAQKSLFEKTKNYLPSIILSAFKNFNFENLGKFKLESFFKISSVETLAQFKQFLLTSINFDSLKNHKALIIKATKFNKDEASTKMKFILNSEEIATIFHHPFKLEIKRKEELEPPILK